MSVKVDLDQLSDTLADYAFAYLITVGDDFHAHTVAVEAVLAEGVFDVGEVGNRTQRNLNTQPGVTLLWPPREPGGYTLIVDGTAELTSDELRVVPEHAVLHRPAARRVEAKPGCQDDCVPLER